MSEITSQTIDLSDAIDKHLNARSLSKSISTLLLSKRKTIDFSPYYQRNYVWDTDKATFFIESILLGIEIPPLIMFSPFGNKKKYEVIDGRQRFETIKRFYEGDFKLTKKGLRSLSGLKGLNFLHLNPEIQDVFLNTTIRIIEFSTVGEHPNQNELEDRIKKEIFSRYNSGITPLKTLEVQRARHLGDNFTKIMEEEFKSKPEWLSEFKNVFFASPYSKEPTDAECQAKIRELLVLEHFPINIYASTTGRRDSVEWLYDLYIEGSEDREKILLDFIQKVNLLNQLFITLNEKQWIIYQGVYWGLVILQQNDVDLPSFFDKKTIENTALAIKDKIEIFTGDSRGFSNITNQRFEYISKTLKNELKRKRLKTVHFKPYLKGRIEESQDIQKAADVTDTLKQLDTMRLNRPDAVTKTIEDLISDMATNSFIIRPAYQRQEVINIKKASGIIESMLLGIPLPTIFIFRRIDGTCEVVDGQQRLLSILAFLGESYKNDRNEKTFSKKHHYKLFKKLGVLTDLGGIKYEDLGEEWQDRIWDFELSVVYIDEKLNDKFDPIDLFIRLNNKPYPVKDHSFEMWNSYSERSIVERIKETTNKYSPWFYYRKDNKRMDNEELLSIFTYLSFESRKGIDSVFESVDIYNWAPRPLTFRVSKILMSEWLSTADGESNIDQRNEILSSIDDVIGFIQKVELLTKSLLEASDSQDGSLQKTFNTLLGLKGKTRLQRPFFVLWFLLLGLKHSTVRDNPIKISTRVMDFFESNQVISNTGKESAEDIFRKKIESFWSKFN
ncbi:MAG: DUF262 domain-containing protein [Colwellia sp.]|jgi:Protein of unknown function DUF262.